MIQWKFYWLKYVNCSNALRLVIIFTPEFWKRIYNISTMKTSVKSILMFILLMLSFSVSGSAWNLTERSCCNSICQVTSSSDNRCSSSLDSQDMPGFIKSSLSVSDVELGFKPVSETYSYTNNLRLRRILELADAQKDLMQKFCLLRGNLLVSDKSKSNYFDKDPHNASISCDYYIFALRRILI